MNSLSFLAGSDMTQMRLSSVTRFLQGHSPQRPSKSCLASDARGRRSGLGPCRIRQEDAPQYKSPNSGPTNLILNYKVYKNNSGNII